ncbi:MAG TPA: DNA alkylation repair protein [Terriglobia bacterium]|nr:DNA alkylation repair protein [Terriglobia bacterium]
MAEPLKTFFSAAIVRKLAGDLERVYPRFPAPRFIAGATAGLDGLELLDRAKLIAASLARHLPPAYPEAIDVLLRSLGPEHATDELVGVGMAPFFYLPHVFFVAENGLDHFDVSMRAQYQLTKRFSAEFSIRHFLLRDPERTLATLSVWTRDDNAHVRRLASEGTRLRLPWAIRVPWLDRNPDRVLGLLELLKDDRATLVRRSVANNLNDLGKIHPALLVATCAAWLQQASSERRALVEHALRSAVKRGEPGALALLGFGGKAAVALEDVRFRPRRAHIGDSVVVSFTLRSQARGPQALLVDLAVHFVKAGGRTSRKVFKLRKIDLAARARAALTTKISLAVHTTRKPRPGRHVVDVLVNGTEFHAGAFDVVAAPSKRVKGRTQAKTPSKKKRSRV